MAGGAMVTTPHHSGGGHPLREGFVIRSYIWPFCLFTSLFFLWGFAYGLLDVLNKHFQSTLDVTKLQSTGLQIAYFGFGYLFYSPIAAEILKRKGYKVCVIQALALYSIGAILFWPVAKVSTTTANKKAVFGGFVACTGVIACGLASLEVAANSYVALIPPMRHANFRLQFSQSFNGVASFAGPLIASKYFFSEEHANSLTTVQWVYLAVSGMGALIMAAFVFTKLPEVSEDDLVAVQNAEEAEATEGSIWKTKAPWGFLTQFLYVGAQVTIGAFFLNLSNEAGFHDTKGSQLLSYGLILFTVGRFFGTALLSFISAPLLLGVYAVICAAFVAGIGSIHGPAGVYLAMVCMFFESIMYPVIFVTSVSGLGRHTRRASGMLVAGVSGGMVFPPIQGAIADKWDTRVSFWICFPAFVFIAGFAFFQWNKAGRVFGVDKSHLEVTDIEATQAEESSSEKDGVEKLEKTSELNYVERI